MSALFTTSILPKNYEVIRGQICLCLLTELVNQHTIDNSYPNITKVWEERFIPLNEETETPTINVNISKGENDNRNILKWDGCYYFNIDVYTTADTTDATGPGDQYSMILMNKIIGLVETILMSDAYKRLLLNAGVIIGLPMIERFFIADKGTVKDALSGVVGRIVYRISAIENVVPQLIADVPLEEATTTSYLNGSSYGFYWSLNTAVPPPVNTSAFFRSIRLLIVDSPDPAAQIAVGNGHFIQQQYAPCNILIPKLSTDSIGYLSNRPYLIPFILDGENITNPSYDMATGAWDRTGFGEVFGFNAGDEIIMTFQDFNH